MGIRWWLWAGAILAAFWGSQAAVPAWAELEAHFIDVGQGGSVLLRRGSEAVLYDCGEKRAGPAVVEYLKDLEITRLTLLVSSHAHDDHMGGCPAILGAVKVGQVVHNQSKATTQPWRAFLRAAAKHSGVRELRPEPLTRWLTLVLPWEARGKRFSGEADNSLVLVATDGRVRVVLTGDCEAACERQLVRANVGAAGPLTVTVLLVGHHGSDASSTTAFLDHVKPKIAVIQAGAGNQYGHPERSVLRRLKKAGATVYRTDRHGSIVVTSDGRSVEVEPSR